MYRCRCSTAALEAFVTDFAGISLRQQRAQHYFQHYRRFASHTGQRQLEHAAHSDDDFVPLVHSAPAANNERIGFPQPQHQQPRIEVPEDGAWHAEIELSEPYSTHYSLQERMKKDEDDGENRARDGGQNQGGITVDSVALRGLHTEPDLPRETALAPVLPVQISENESQAKMSPREARKWRRMAEGSYKAAAEERKRQKEHELQMESVMSKINELEDPRKGRKDALEKFKQQQARKQGAKQADQGAERGDEGAKNSAKPKRETWQVQKEALDRKFGDAGWQPRKRLSPDTIEGIRALHASDPAAYTNTTLSEHFKVSPEAIRRILKSKWRPNDQEAEDRRIRWERRGAKKWHDMAEQGVRPPVKWRALGAGGEQGLKEDRIPKRKKSSSDRHLSWDDVVGASRDEEEDGMGSFAQRIL
ncbi:hypothetical protein KC331_g2565 [Hortaea werneckii]|uniref:Required for respiratory growth protein 9, mitochondrial n=1 Tax=Hortaea werneckii TaxID=91943 RepID=A0A3M7CQA8_HORWE|nr:hypothetical protein KC331_g2565 [Hortaea werneckii]KAI7718480.1 hypothetical protein KC353_g3754 [Hortaea werneckii]RMY54308.1 hypothetical protein D0865_04789 [Hortaea werneckii]